jgi:ArsR family transcriptional regulator, arsenate/arsenite/antimonite-responsive transcriptional repressor
MSMGRQAKPFDLVQLFAALADPTRLRLLNLMNGREVCVCYFVEVLNQGQPKISRHLAYLRRAGIVEARREGKWMHYRIERPDDARAGAILDVTLKSLETDRNMQADLARLGKACCEPQRFVTLQGAPTPMVLKGRHSYPNLDCGPKDTVIPSPESPPPSTQAQDAPSQAQSPPAAPAQTSVPSSPDAAASVP